MRKFFSVFLIMSLMVQTSGCSFFAAKTETILITVSEPNAEISVNGRTLERGATQAEVKRNENVSILVKKNGFEPAGRTISKTLSPVGIVDVIGGCFFLIPLIGLAAAGAWIPQETNVSIVLDPVK